MKILIKKGRVVTAVDDYTADILIENETVSTIGKSLDIEADMTLIVDSVTANVGPGSELVLEVGDDTLEFQAPAPASGA